MNERVEGESEGAGQRLKEPAPAVEQRSLTQDELRRENERLREKVAASEKHIADRERQLAGRKKDSTNSSKPPSSDGPLGGASQAVNRDIPENTGG